MKSCLIEDQSVIGNGICDQSLNISSCCFDGGDCWLEQDILGMSSGCNSLLAFGNVSFDMICQRSERERCYWASSDCQDLDNFFMDQLCPGCRDIAIVGDHSCNPEIASDSVCCFDIGDCIVGGQQPNDCSNDIDMICDMNQIQRKQSQQHCSSLADMDCMAADQSLCSSCAATEIMDGSCSDNLVDDPTCCFDALDCHVCYTCPVVSFVGDNFCDIDLLTESCCLDGGDCKSSLQHAAFTFCSDCSFEKYLHQIGDGSCHMELANNDCCFDGGDCFATTGNSQVWCSSCLSHRPGIFYNLYLANGLCEEQYNEPECCYDGGDCSLLDLDSLCKTCHLDHYQGYVANRKCDGIFNNLDCCFDGGHCEVDACPTCLNADLKSKINDGICDRFLLSFPECCQDGDDCKHNAALLATACSSCPVGVAHAFVGTGQCDDFMNNPQCCFDGGDCDSQFLWDCDDCDNNLFSSRAGGKNHLKRPKISYHQSNFRGWHL